MDEIDTVHSDLQCGHTFSSQYGSIRAERSSTLITVSFDPLDLVVQDFSMGVYHACVSGHVHCNNGKTYLLIKFNVHHFILNESLLH